ncbi:hypothetical protein DDB_G0276099 [Dictyostelium discoideum AX4]|uniref:Uncharacterized protein n=1 Tax=Dictyostelium discoideum TaxID=44689 RepID=Q75JI5_DICDI|nr:hypothetical protein DDB_G0276099 [Dictyostelium discoideum AX4]EAL69349.1 hypothetical protein DDB_G0276099 [Dictyostelium discoideum AX4]|eukprot:XP_643275.1 hypothetical protein DDB_G0276099 [Dictyostelium discoideum AX4]
MEKFQRELTDQAIKKIVSTLRSILYRIETKDCKDVVGLLEPYMDEESYQNIRETFLRYQEKHRLNEFADDEEDILEDEEEDEDEDNINKNIDDNTTSTTNKCGVNGIENISNKYLLQIQDVAARLVSSSTASASTSNGSGSNGESGTTRYNRIADRQSRENSSQSSNGGGGGGSGENGTRKKRRGASKGFPLNWGLIMSMASNITLDQVQSMLNVLIMVLSRTPINVLFKQFHEYKFIISSVFDLLNAILRGDIKDIGTCLIIAVIGVIRFSQRKNLTLITTLEVAKYLYNSGNKKKFGLIRSVSLVAFLSNLFKLVNPPPVTPLDVIQLVKSQIQSRL